MTALRALIADDEPLANKRLAKLLATAGEVEVIGELSNGQDALQAILDAKPDVAFLDIEMPRLDGFDVVEALANRSEATTPPVMIFVTAFPDLAARAFDTGAADFISKPVKLSRLVEALRRAREAIDARRATQKLVELQAELASLRELRAGTNEAREIWVRQGREVVRVDLGDIERIEAEGEYVRLHGDRRSYLQRGPIGAFLEEDAAQHFVRVHRSHAVDMDRVKAICRNTWGGSVLELQSGTKIPVGRKFRDRLNLISAN